MANKVIMPKQGLQMTEGTIIKWLKKEGDQVKKDEPLFEMETDKLTITIDAADEGTLLKIVRGEGEAVPITQTIAVIGRPDEDISGLVQDPQTQAVPAGKPLQESVQPEAVQMPVQDGLRLQASPRAKMIAQDKGVDISKIKGSGPDGYIIEKDILAHVQYGPVASPLAKKIAQLEDVELQQLSGSGARGKIMRDDVLSAVRARRPKAENREEHVVPMSSMRKVIAQRMVESLRVHAQLTHAVRVDMTNAAELRETYKKEDKKISYNDIVLMAASRSLIDFPMMNACITEEGILMRGYVNLGMAVAIEGGLIVPNIKDADLMRLEEISKTARELAQKAKENKLTEEDFSGGTFTVSNLGCLGWMNLRRSSTPPNPASWQLARFRRRPLL